jgi:peptide deformylase
MNKTDIISLPNAHLRERSKKVGFITDEVHELIEGMKTATIDWENSREHEVGVALAAIQIDRPLRIVVIRNDFDNRDDKTFTVFINPEITKYEGKVEQDFEGCLSVPDIYGKVPRHAKVRVRAQDEKGAFFRVTAEGFLARVFQHEIDHTNGIVFIDRIKNDPTAFYRLLNDGHLEKIDYDEEIHDNNILW